MPCGNTAAELRHNTGNDPKADRIHEWIKRAGDRLSQGLDWENGKLSITVDDVLDRVIDDRDYTDWKTAMRYALMADMGDAGINPEYAVVAVREMLRILAPHISDVVGEMAEKMAETLDVGYEDACDRADYLRDCE